MNGIALHDAIAKGQVAKVRRALDQDPELRTTRSEGLTPLLRALFAGHPEIVDVLLDHGAAVDGWEAAALGSVARLEAAFASTTELERLDATQDLGWTPLHLAAFMGRREALVWLLDRGADPVARSKNREANTPLHAALAGRREPAVVRILLERGADPAAKAAAGVTPLHLAASRGDTGAVDLLMARGASPVPMDDGRMPSALARERGHPDLADRLEAIETSPGATGGRGG